MILRFPSLSCVEHANQESWQWQTLPSKDPGFGSSLCRVEIGAACIDVKTGEISVNGMESSAYLQQCGDSYSSWRRIRLTQQLPERREQKAWILHLTPLAATNLCLASGFKCSCCFFICFPSPETEKIDPGALSFSRGR